MTSGRQWKYGDWKTGTSVTWPLSQVLLSSNQLGS